MIYFIQNLQTHAVKIGRSDDPQGRLDTLRTANCDPLALLGTIPGEGDLEAALHVRFADRRIRGEWFRGDAEFLEAVHRLIEGHRTRPRLSSHGAIPKAPTPGAAAPVRNGPLPPFRGPGPNPPPIPYTDAVAWIRDLLERSTQFQLEGMRNMAHLAGIPSATYDEILNHLGVERFRCEGAIWVRGKL